MSIKISWSALRSTPDTLTLYWSNTTFTPDTLPTNTVTLDPAATEYTDTTVPANTLRYYMVKATKAGLNDMFSQCLLFGHFPKAGPGRNGIFRGDWNGGLMDILTPAQVFTIAGLKTALGLATNFAGAPAESTLTAWYKFFYKGKILLIPNAPLSAAGVIQWPALYNAGLIYGVDGPGVAPFDLTTGGLSPAVPTTVNQKKVVTIGSDSYLVRTPRLSMLPTDQLVPNTKESFIGGEWWETMGRMASGSAINAADALNMPTEKWGDGRTATQFGCAATPNFQANKLALCVDSSTWSSYIGRNTTSAVGAAWVHWVPVLELIP